MRELPFKYSNEISDFVKYTMFNYCDLVSRLIAAYVINYIIFHFNELINSTNLQKLITVCSLSRKKKKLESGAPFQMFRCCNETCFLFERNMGQERVENKQATSYYNIQYTD